MDDATSREKTPPAMTTRDGLFTRVLSAARKQPRRRYITSRADRSQSGAEDDLQGGYKLDSMQLPRVALGLLTVVLAGVLAALLFVRSTPRDQHTYALQGQVQSITPDRQEAIVKHGEIKGLMPAMTMPYRLKDKKEFDALKPGDLIDGTLVIVSNDAFLTDVKKTGEAPIEKPPAETLV